AQACPGKCGAVSDGCDAVIQCDASNGGVDCTPDQVCGGFAGNLQANGCVDKPMCTPTTCAAVGAQCGQVGDGCQGSLDCNANGGGCTGGQICGTGPDSNHCVDPPACITTPPATA